MDDKEPPVFKNRGMLHDLTVAPNENNTGWIFSVSSLGGYAHAAILQGSAEELAQMLLAGPGEIVYECAEHKKIAGRGPCLDCLL